MSRIIRLAVAGIILLCCVQQVHSDIVTGLVHHWKFDETGDLETAFDSVGNNHASLGGYNINDPTWVPGRIGNALSFSKTPNYALTQSGIVHDQYTVAFWLKRLDLTGLYPRIATPLGEEWFLINDADNRGVGFYRDVNCLIPPVLNQWEHYAIAYDRITGEVTVYKNGFFCRSGTSLSGGPDFDPWIFAHNQDTNNQLGSFNGLLDDMRIYDRLLNATDVLELFNYPTNTTAAESYNIIRGNYLGGDLPDIVDSDNSYLRFFGLPTFVPLPPVQVEFESTLPTDAPPTLSFTMEASVNAVPVVQSVELFNYNTSRYELVHIKIATPFDSQVVVQTTGNILRFVESGTGNVKARLGWNRWEIFPVLFLAVNIDQVVWTTTQ